MRSMEVDSAVLNNSFFTELRQYIRTAVTEFSMIPVERRQALERVSEYIFKKITEGNPARLIFICTQNSRRSQMSQLWAQAAARYFGILDVTTFSGGTEITSFNPRVVKALAKTGFQLERSAGNENPFYNVRMGVDMTSVQMFSKTYSDCTNPQQGFCAVLNCSNIDRNCPIIANAEERFLIAYEDPSRYDDTSYEIAEYDATCREISREMCWLIRRALLLTTSQHHRQLPSK